MFVEDGVSLSVVHLFILFQRATIDDDGIKKFQHAVITPIKVTIGVKYGLVALGAFLIIVIIIVAIIKFVRQSREVFPLFLDLTLFLLSLNFINKFLFK